jgi:hypothetical protein
LFLKTTPPGWRDHITRSDCKNDWVHGWRLNTKTESQQAVWLILYHKIFGGGLEVKGRTMGFKG